MAFIDPLGIYASAEQINQYNLQLLQLMNTANNYSNQEQQAVNQQLGQMMGGLGNIRQQPMTWQQHSNAVTLFSTATSQDRLIAALQQNNARVSARNRMRDLPPKRRRTFPAWRVIAIMVVRRGWRVVVTLAGIVEVIRLVHGL